MLKFKGSKDLHKIVVLNPKGGSGKTTLAFNLAGYLASAGRKVALIDMDRQGSSTRWLQNRSSRHPQIHGISVTYSAQDANRDRCVVVPYDVKYAVIDAPAGLAGDQLIDYTCGAHAILVPVLPSDLDIHAASRLISDLLLVAQVSRRKGRLGVVANRVNERTIAYQQLTKFLNRLSISVIGILRDSQNYTWAAANGICIHEMPPSRAGKDLAQWEMVTQWLERRLAMPITPRDLLRPADTASRNKKRGLHPAVMIPVAAALALFVVSAWLWRTPRDAIIETPSEPILLTENSLTAPDEPVEVDIREESQEFSSGDALKNNWQLSGIAKTGGSNILMLSNRSDNTTRRVSEDLDLDGWTVTDAGRDYAVLVQNGEQVRLVLNEEAAH
ncbi:MAG: ParA family protein [Gammaproteobacteria bacterium]|nr:ParA family protein [Gammaproteobacteria bacterium]